MTRKKRMCPSQPDRKNTVCNEKEQTPMKHMQPILKYSAIKIIKINIYN